MAPVGVAGETGRRCFPAQIAIDALIIHVKPPGKILRKLVGNACHNYSGSLRLPMPRSATANPFSKTLEERCPSALTRPLRMD